MTAIGFIGLGVMGRPMAEHLVRAGHEVTVHNRSQDPVRALVSAGAKAAGSAADGGVQEPHPAGRRRLADLAGGVGPDGAHVDQQRALAGRLEDSPLAQDHRLDVGRVGHHGDDDVGPVGHLGRRAAGLGPGLDQGPDRLRGAVVDGDLVAGPDQVLGHGLAHHAEADEPDRRHRRPPRAPDRFP